MSYEREGGSYHPEDGDTLNSGWVRANESPKMLVKNKRGWSIVVNKEWSDKDFTSSHDPVFIAVYCGGTLVPQTVSCIAHPSTSKRYFFDSLLPGADFEDYVVYEVELDNPVVNENGELISYSGIHKRLEESDQTTINAVTNHSGTSSPYSYAVTYEYGTPASQAEGTDVIENVRTDTITNTRMEGVVLTLYDMYTREPLADGKFTLTQGDTTLGTFISDSQGRITILYDFDRNTDYTLTETEPPGGYPEYYLHRDFDRNYSFSGTPVIGAGADESSDAFVIYAHKMRNDTMFGTLDYYADTEWAKQHRDIEFDAPEEHRVYRVFAAVQTKVGGENELKYYEKTGKLSDKEYTAFVKELSEASVIEIDDRPTDKQQLLLLSTCSYHTEDGRFVVAAYRI